MIRVNRGDPPPDFAIRRANWETGLQQARVGDPKITASKYWNRVRPEIRNDAEVLAARLHRKCAFCESKMSHVMSPQIEHFRPKSNAAYEGRMFDWSNWLLSCGVCNTKKGRFFDGGNEDLRIIDPASEPPSDHIGFVGSIPLGLSSRGTETIKRLRLRREALNSYRTAWLAVVGVLLLAALDGSLATRTAARRYLIWSMQDEAPFAAMVREFIGEMAPAFAKPAVPHPHIAGEGLVEDILRLVKRREPDIAQLS